MGVDTAVRDAELKEDLAWKGDEVAVDMPESIVPQIPDGPPGGFPTSAFESETNADQKAIEAEVAAYDFESALEPTHQSLEELSVPTRSRS